MQNNQTEQIGLDIGTSAVRLVEVSPGGERPNLTTFSSHPLPSDLTALKGEAEKKQLSGLVKDLCEQASVKTDKTVVSLPAQHFNVSVMQVPQMDSDDLNGHIFSKMSEQMSMDKDGLQVDWHIVNQSVGNGEMLVFVVAAPGDVVSSYVDIVKMAGLSLRAVEVNALALARSVIKDGSRPVVVLDFGQQTSEVAVIWQRVPYKSSSINVGESALISAIEQSLNVDNEEASQFLKQYGASETKFEGQILKAINSPLNDIVRTITEASEMFASFSMDAQIEKIIVTGGITALPEVPSYIANHTNMPVEIANPWVNLSYPATQHDQLMNQSMQFGVASGLALRDFV